MARSICVPRLCGLCRFELQRGDDIVAVRRSDRDMSPSYKYSIGGFIDRTLDVDYVQCRGRCDHDEQRIGCHVICIEVTSPETFTNILDAAAHAFEPPAIADKRRIRWFEFYLADVIRTASRHISSLPREVLSNIAAWALDDRSTCHHLAVHFASQTCAETEGNTSVQFSEKIYARHVEFEGVQYIGHLRNTPGGNQDFLLFDPSLSTFIDSLYIASDHLGIRRLLFADSSKPCAIEQEIGIWWKAVKLEDVGGLIRIRSDGLKLRELVVDDTIVLQEMYWGLPHLSSVCSRFEDICGAEPSNHMSVVSCNDPQTTAYSLCWNWEILMLHAHRAGESLDFYQALRTMDEAAMWLYMPLHEGEVLTQIWKFEGELRTAIGLLLVTDQRRSTFLGVQPRPNWGRSKWTLLDLPGKATSHIYAETTTCGVRRLGFQSPRPRYRDRRPAVEWPTPYPLSRHDEYYAWNRARLKHVVEIVPCNRQRMGKPIIIGLLLRYADGTSACVGQIRLDCLQRAMTVDPTSTLWLGFWLTGDGPCIGSAILAKEQPVVPACETWFEVEWRDDLQWWFSNKKCRLSHQGRLSPKTTK
ncbi:hypothetical protein CABS02_14334 [Colletotrichum abscissum]|uniref:Uncharacterized protein n=1 Tax=Colletotrichum abscissum TaxID=1671311 RepID=A0A9P9X1Q3_9PEZI|nr:hypothetical protein CABS02_14334 [Colletotrichum abscissum]